MSKMPYATCSILILFSLYFAQTINGQTCQGKSQYDSCSSNSACGCLPLSISDDVSICAILGVSCSRLQPCQSPGDVCERTDHVCVRHPRCNSLTPLCYPLSMIDQRLCPPSPSTPKPSFTTTTGFPSWNTTAYPFYNSTSYPFYNSTSYPLYNSTSYPFYNSTSYPLYNSTSYPFWNTTAYPFYNSTSYPFWNSTAYPFWNSTVYPFHNSTSYPFYNSTSYPFYNSTSYPFWNSTAYPFYNSTFYPFYNSTSYPFWNSTVYPFHNSTSYPFYNSTTFPFYNSTSYPFYNSTSYPFYNSTADSLYNATVPTSTNGHVPASVYSYYTNALTIYSAVCPGTVNKYYHAISVFAKTPGLYTFTSMSYMNTAAVLYKDAFNPYYPNWYLVSSVNTFDSNHQFKLSHNLIAGGTYILVVTTTYHGQMGSFTVTASGPDYLQLY